MNKSVMSSFNPRTRDGCEYTDRESVMKLWVSIHAPVMGANIIINQ